MSCNTISESHQSFEVSKSTLDCLQWPPQPSQVPSYHPQLQFEANHLDHKEQLHSTLKRQLITLKLGRQRLHLFAQLHHCHNPSNILSMAPMVSQCFQLSTANSEEETVMELRQLQLWYPLRRLALSGQPKMPRN